MRGHRARRSGATQRKEGGALQARLTRKQIWPAEAANSVLERDHCFIVSHDRVERERDCRALDMQIHAVRRLSWPFLMLSGRTKPRNLG